MQTVLVAKAKLKPKVFEYLRSVESGTTEVCITDHGEPVAKIVSMRADEDRELALLRGLVLHYADPCEPVEAAWEVLS